MNRNKHNSFPELLLLFLRCHLEEKYIKIRQLPDERNCYLFYNSEPTFDDIPKVSFQIKKKKATFCSPIVINLYHPTRDRIHRGTVS